jgi:hypothetical protein
MPNDAAYVTMGGECAAAAAYTPAAVAAPQPTAAAAASCAGCNNAYLELDLTLSTGTTFCSNCGQRMRSRTSNENNNTHHTLVRTPYHLCYNTTFTHNAYLALASAHLVTSLP